MTTRKVAIAFEEQVINQVPADSRSKYIDIIVTDKRTIYKI
jgi:5-formyltetrahydrofolate cyclo-ligase